MKKNALFLSILIMSMIGLTVLHSKSQKPVHADEQAVSSSNWDTPFKVSTGARHALRPTAAAAPDGRTVLVVYSATTIGDDDVFDIKYSFSDNHGNPDPADWTVHQDVYPASSTKSDYPHATFDQDGRAHVVWVENSSLTYVNSTNLSSGFGVPQTLSASPVPPGALNPFVVTYNDDVHITWVESTTGNPIPNIYHIQSTDNGVSWGGGVTNISNTSGQADKPTAAVDDDGNLHVVYQELVTSDFFDIFYTMLPAGEITFTTPVTITDNIPAGPYSMAEPSILYHNGRLEVSVTQANNIDTLPDLKEAEQFIYYITCAGSCGTAANWEPQAISQPDIPPVPSYPALYIDVSPYYLSSSILNLGSCTLIVYDGKISYQPENKEQIFNASSCTNWGNGRRALVIDDETRAIRPSAAVQNDWWVYVAYEEFVDEDNIEIYLLRNIPGIYLPVIAKSK